jgi:hypothetical protein
VKNFDTDSTTRRAQRIAPDNLQFTIAGETFYIHSGFSPDSPQSNVLDEWRAVTGDTSDADFGRIADDVVLQFLTPGQEDKWKSVRDPSRPDPITGSDLVDIIIWLIEAVLSRPLASSSSSSTGSTENPPDSKESPRIGTPLTVVPPSKAAKGSKG